MGNPNRSYRSKSSRPHSAISARLTAAAYPSEVLGGLSVFKLEKSAHLVLNAGTISTYANATIDIAAPTATRRTPNAFEKPRP